MTKLKHKHKTQKYIKHKNTNAKHKTQTQTCAQILTTAVFSMTMLGKSLNTTKWISLVLLTLGVVAVNYKPGGSNSADTEGKSMLIGILYTSVFVCLHLN